MLVGPVATVSGAAFRSTTGVVGVPAQVALVVGDGRQQPERGRVVVPQLPAQEGQEVGQDVAGQDRVGLPRALDGRVAHLDDEVVVQLVEAVER